jgi:neutral ceramidase
MSLILALLLAGDLKAGFGSADITPEPGAQMPGGFNKNLSKGVRDPLYAVACVVTDGTTPLALVGIDALFIGKHTVKEARALIRERTNIPESNVLVGASHAHTGGPILDCLGSDEDPAYSARVAKAIAKAVEDAWKSAKPCELAVGTGTEATLAYNRRFLMKDGREITHPGKPGTPHHAEIVQPAGPIDPDLGVLAVRAPGGAIAGLVVHFTCHVTVIGGSGYSADYPGFLRKHLKARYGEAVEVVFLQGCCGDITQVDNRSTAREFGPEHADLMGQKLAAEAVRAINRAAWAKEVATAATAETLPLAIRPEPDAVREKPPFGLGSGPDAVFENERRLVAEQRAKSPTLDAEVQGLRIGPLGIATTGAEWFVEHGLKIKAASPHATTWVVGYANDYLGYVPTANAFVAGGYECRTARSSKLSIDAGQSLVEACLRQLNKVK